MGFLDILQRRTGHAKQVDVNPHESLINDPQPGMRQQPVNIRNPAICGVFHRKHRKFRFAGADSIYRILETTAGQHLHIGALVAAGFVAIGTKFALDRDFLSHGCVIFAKT